MNVGKPIELDDMLRILDEFASLKELINEYAASAKKKDETRSEERNELFAALAKAQGEYPAIKSNKQNPFFKSNYTNLDGILVPLRPVLSKHGLAFNYEKKIEENGAEILWGILSHTSGQWTSCQFRIVPAKNDPQAYGSTLKYAMRYAAQTLLGVSTSDDPDDDDAEEAMKPHRFKDDKGTDINYDYKAIKQSEKTITKSQIEELEYELKGYPDLAERLLETYKINSIADLPENLYRNVITRLREVKLTRSGAKLT